MGLDASQKWKNWRISVTNQCLFLSLCIPVFIYLFILERHPDYSQVPNYHTYFKSSGNDFDLFSFIHSPFSFHLKIVGLQHGLELAGFSLQRKTVHEPSF